MMEKKNYKILIVSYERGLFQILPLVKNLRKENPLAVIHFLIFTDGQANSVIGQIREYASKVIYIQEYTGKYAKHKCTAYLEKGLFLFRFVLLSCRKYDIVNIHYAQPVLLKAMPWLRRITKNIVITPWGSDVLRVKDENAIKRMRKIYSYASSITVPSYTQLGEAVVEKYKYDSRKMYPLRFGMEFVDYIEKAKPNKTIEEAKARFCVSGRYVITCGYSTALSHRHEAIIDAVNSIKGQLPNNLTLLFPFTYGWGSPEYVQMIKDKCLEEGIDAVCVEEWLDLEDLYTLRMATDMIVHVQTTDAGASSVMQYILCRKKIVHGSWMKYMDLERYKPLFYYPVNSLEQLGEVILDAYHSKGIDIPEKVIKTIMARGWNNEIKKWDGFFTSLASEKPCSDD